MGMQQSSEEGPGRIPQLMVWAAGFIRIAPRNQQMVGKQCGAFQEGGAKSTASPAARKEDQKAMAACLRQGWHRNAVLSDDGSRASQASSKAMQQPTATY
jgi:hypothetical protein